jgi:hypothetical protein
MVQKYGKSTSTGVLRKHLYIHHMEEWLVECARLKISIKAKEALEAIAAFQGVKPGSQTQQRQQFTQEHFIKALIEFIVATDQVFSFFLL